MLKPEILDIIKTRQDRDLLVSELDILLSSVYQKKESEFKKYLQVYLRSQSARAILASLDAEGIDTASFVALKTHLEKLQEEIAELPVLKLTVAIEPTIELTREICQSARKRIDSRLLLDLEVDQTIIGGAVMSFQGLFRDFSLKTKISHLYGGVRF